MAGHSHSTNVKYRKDRQDHARSQLFLKLRKKIENIIRQEGKITPEIFSMARENSFPKEKVYQIFEKIKSKGEKNSFTRNLYQALFGIFIYLEGNQDNIDNVVQKLKLKKIPLSSLPNYFQLCYSLKLELEEDYNLEEYLLTHFPIEILEKINYNEQSSEITSLDKQITEKMKNIITKNGLKLRSEEEKTF